MKAIIFVISCLLALALAEECAYNHGDGRPACNAEEAGYNWRNNWDPTHYWSCATGEAVSVMCEAETGFMTAAQGCVSWSEWEWVPPCNPPSVS